ncbi:response regulator [Phreatobacter stygius]|uniref:Response regulator n=1 Tax=Phreatobacter stygius TaxID=1940610 RepID=A0A4D7BIZ2_9HYPH|nr:response regulator [Phreatobacter stygius]QCI67782.1 response regulator [Phreatobacter stygius]
MANTRVLIVEDDPFIALDLEATVGDGLDGDAELVVVGSLDEANKAAEAPLSFALLDIDVIGGKTFALAQALASRGTPFAFVSGSLPADLPELLRAVPFVRKPFSAPEIRRLVENVLNAEA